MGEASEEEAARRRVALIAGEESTADEESLALAEKLVHGKISPSVKPGQMRILDEPVRFTVGDASVGGS